VTYTERSQDAPEQPPEPEITEETAPEPAESADEIEAESVIQEEDVKMPRMDGGTFSLDASLHGPLRIRRPPHRRDIP
jgi:hypothetical protein